MLVEAVAAIELGVRPAYHLGRLPYWTGEGCAGEELHREDAEATDGGRDTEARWESL